MTESFLKRLQDRARELDKSATEGIVQFIPPGLRRLKPSLDFVQSMFPSTVLREAGGKTQRFFESGGKDYKSGIGALVDTASVGIPLAFFGKLAQRETPKAIEGVTDFFMAPSVKTVDGAIDTSKRAFITKAPLAVAATALAAQTGKGIVDLVPPVPAAKVAKAGAKTGVSLATGLAAKLKALGEAKDKIILKPTKADDVKGVGDYLSATNKINDEMNVVTVQLNDTVEKLVKGKGYKDFMKMPEKEFLELARLTNKVVYSFRNKAGEIVGSLDPLRDPKIQEALDKAITDRGLRPQLAKDFAKEIVGSLRLSGDKKVDLPSMDLSGLNLPKMLPSSGQATKSIFEPEAKKGRQLLIVSCGDKKCPDVGNMKALDRYLGPIFTSIRKAGVPENVDVAILSAKHGLIRADTKIENYDQLMTKDKVNDFISDPNQMSKIAETMRGYDNILVQGGDNYKNVIKSAAGDIPFTEVPKGRGIGDQRSFVAKFLEDQAKVNRSNPTEPAFHYSTYTDKQIKNFSIEKIEDAYKGADTNYSSILGLHVGTPEAAAQRSRSNLKAGYFTKDSDKISYAKPTDQFTLNYDFKDEDMIPMGSYYALDIDTSKPFKNPNSKTGLWTEKELDDYIVEEIDRNPTVSALYKQKSVETRGDKIFELNQKIGAAEKEAFEIFRKGLASKGYTNIPYINAVEDRGSISQIMLIDRPKGDKVIKSKITAEPMEKGGVAGLSDIARDMFKGPKGIGAYQPFMVG